MLLAPETPYITYCILFPFNILFAYLQFYMLSVTTKQRNFIFTAYSLVQLVSHSLVYLVSCLPRPPQHILWDIV